MNNNKIKTLEEQVRVMSDKLKQAAEQVPAEDLIVNYDNGGGQTGVRENPFFPAYEKLLSSYIKAVMALNELSGNETVTTDSIAELRRKFKVIA